MRGSMLAVAAAVILAGAAPGERCLLRPLSQPASKRPAGLTAVADPAEPPMAVQASCDEGGLRPPQSAWAGRPVAVAAGPKGTTLTLETPTWTQGRAALTFKNAAPPMRFSLRLLKMPPYDQEAFTLTSGTLSLAVGPVSASVTTKHFDARGREQRGPEGASYTVTARRWDGEVEVEVRRSRGAALGKELVVGWRSDLGYRQ